MQGYAVKFLQDPSQYVGRRLFPQFNTGEQSANYYVLDQANALNFPTNIQRAPGSAYTRSKMTISDDTFATREYGHEESVDDRERKKYAIAINADIAAVRRATAIILFNQELRIKNKATGGSVPTATPSTKWNRALAGDPISDVDAAKTAIHKGCGMEANTMLVNRDVFNELKEHPKVLDKIKYSERGIVTADILAAVFGVQQFLIAGVLYNSANEGQTLSAAYLWSDSVILAHVETAQDLQAPNFGRCFAWSGETGPDGVLVESYRDDSIRSDVHRVRQDLDEKLVGAAAGYHLSDVLT